MLAIGFWTEPKDGGWLPGEAIMLIGSWNFRYHRIPHVLGAERGWRFHNCNGPRCNQSRLCNEASVTAPNDEVQRTSALANTRRAGESVPIGEDAGAPRPSHTLALCVSSVWLFQSYIQ